MLGSWPRTFSRSRVKIRIVCWRTHPGWPAFILFFLHCGCFNGHLCKKWSKCGEKCLTEEFGHASHLGWHQSVHCKFLLTWNHPSWTESLDSLHARTASALFIIQFQKYSIWVGKHVVEKALETNEICLWYYEMCQRKDLRSPPTRWKQFQLFLHLRGWLVIAFVIVLLQVQLTSVQRFHRQSDSGALATEGQQCCIWMLIVWKVFFMSVSRLANLK